MSKQESAARDLNQDEAAQVQESGTRDLSRTPGTDAAAKRLLVLSNAPAIPGAAEAKEVRDNVQTATETEEVPTYDDAIKAFEAVAENDNKGLRDTTNNFARKDVRFIKIMGVIEGGKEGDGGWHCVGREDGPLTKGQSDDLAKLVNSMIDPVKMLEKAQENRARKAEDKAKAKAKEDAEQLNTMITKIETFENPEDLKGLKELARLCDKAQYVRLTRNGMKAVKSFDGSQALVDAFDAQKDKLEVAGFMNEIEYCPNEAELDILAYQIERAGFIKKEITGNNHNDWEPKLIKGKNGSQELVDALLIRKAEFQVEAFREVIKGITSDEGLERFTWQVLHQKGLVKKINTTLDNGKNGKQGDQDWDIEVVEGKPGSEILVSEVKERRLAIPVEAKEHARKAKERANKNRERAAAEARKKLAAL